MLNDFLYNKGFIEFPETNKIYISNETNSIKKLLSTYTQIYVSSYKKIYTPQGIKLAINAEKNITVKYTTYNSGNKIFIELFKIPTCVLLPLQDSECDIKKINVKPYNISTQILDSRSFSISMIISSWYEEEKPCYVYDNSSINNATNKQTTFLLILLLLIFIIFKKSKYLPYL